MINKHMDAINTKKKILIVILMVVCLSGCDLATKKIAYDNLKGQSVQSYLSGTLKLFYTENSGGMLSLGNGLPDKIKFTIFVVGITLLLVFLFLYSVFKKNLTLLQFLSCILFIAGGLGNLIDRIFHDGKVTDFLVIQMFGLGTGVFNFADFYVTVGLLLLIIAMFVQPKKNNEDTIQA